MISISVAWLASQFTHVVNNLNRWSRFTSYYAYAIRTVVNSRASYL
jgi:hypothetical protein